MFWRRIEAQRRGRGELGDQLIELLVARPEALCSSEAPFGAMPEIQAVAALHTERRVID
jgi:hypothetical protein